MCKNRNINIHSKLYDYSVEFVASFADTLKEIEGNVVYVIDKNVFHLYETCFYGIDTGRIFFMDPVETKKNMETVMDIICFWKDIHVTKDWKVICLGGGITQDVTTIASNLFLRNVDWYFFPTTLLSMCDSCIGGKCGINLGEYKNQIGVFYPPKKIFIDVNFIHTLSEEDYMNGWGELLKFSLTEDTGFFNRIKQEECYIPCKNIAEYIFKGLEVKKKVIEADEFESDLRRILNYGHTFGHALEAYTHYKIPHGIAVIWGMDVANYISLQEKLITKQYYLEIKQLVKGEFLKKEIVIEDSDSLFEIIKTDKKVRNHVLNFALLNGESSLTVYPIAIDERLKNIFYDYLRETHEYYNS